MHSVALIAHRKVRKLSLNVGRGGVSTEEQQEKANQLRMAKLAADAYQHERALGEARKQTEAQQEMLRVEQTRLAHQLASEMSAKLRKATMVAWRNRVVKAEQYVDSLSKVMGRPQGLHDTKRAEILLSLYHDGVNAIGDSLEEFSDIERLASLRTKIESVSVTLGGKHVDLVSKGVHNYFRRLQEAVEKCASLDDRSTLIVPLDLNLLEKQARSGMFLSREALKRRLNEQFIVGKNALDQRSALVASAISSALSLRQVINEGITSGYLDSGQVGEQIVPDAVLALLPDDDLEQLVERVQFLAGKRLEWTDSLQAMLVAEYAQHTEALTSWKERMLQSVAIAPSLFTWFFRIVGGVAVVLLLLIVVGALLPSAPPPKPEARSATPVPVTDPVATTPVVTSPPAQVEPNAKTCVGLGLDDKCAPVASGLPVETVSVPLPAAEGASRPEPLSEAPKAAFQTASIKTRRGVLSVRNGTLVLNDESVRDVNNITIESDATALGRIFDMDGTEVILVHTNCTASTCSAFGDVRLVTVGSNGLTATRSFGYGKELIRAKQTASGLTLDYGTFGVVVYANGDLQIPPAIAR